MDAPAHCEIVCELRSVQKPLQLGDTVANVRKLLEAMQERMLI